MEDDRATVDLQLEAALVARALRGDGRAFGELVAPHLDRCFRLAMRTAGDRAVAEEALQEALAIAHRDLPLYQVGTSLRGWLCALAMRCAATLGRSERRRSLREGGSAEPAAPAGPEAVLQARDLAQRLDRALACLTDKRREAALLRFDGGLQHNEIAAAMGISDAAARQLVCEATKALRLALPDPNGELP